MAHLLQSQAKLSAALCPQENTSLSPEPSSPRPLYRDAMRAALLGVIVNFGLGAVKLVGGMVAQSVALISDAVNSLGDSLTSIVTFAALWYAQRPPDEEHPYGHTRAETVAAAYMSFVIIGSAMYVGWEAATRLTQQHGIPPVWTLWIAGGNILIKEGLFWHKRRVGRRTGSMAIIASAWDHRSDAFCSLAVLIGLVVVRWAGSKYAWADEGAALVVVCAIVITGGRLLRRSTVELLDPQADPKILARVRQLAEAVPGVKAVEKLWVRKTGIEYLVDVHIQVDGSLTVEDGHRIGHNVKDRLVHEVQTVRDVLVHLEPFAE